MSNPAPISIVIPTYGRDDVLVDTLSALLALEVRASEILIVDQTSQHSQQAESQLTHWEQAGLIRWIKTAPPSITRAMNLGLTLATHPIVLFLDDDIVPHAELITGHTSSHSQSDVTAVVGRVVQPWQHGLASPVEFSRGQGLKADFEFPFYGQTACDVQNVMAGNLSVKRDAALNLQGFDENFQGAAYRFESDFARRVVASGGRILFCPTAGIDHLRVPSGGTRAKGNHLTSASPAHSVGDYYYAFKHGGPVEHWTYALTRFARSVRTRFHLTHPWWIPVTLVGELRGLWLGRQMATQRRREGGLVSRIPEASAR